MRKLFQLLSIVFVLVILSACTLGSSTEEADTGTTDSEPAESDNEEASSADSGPAEFTVGVTYTTPETGSTHLGMERFKELVEERTDGSVEIELYPGGQLYASEREAIEATQAGNIEMTVAASAPVAGFDSRFVALDLPFIFKDHETAYEALDGELGQTLLDGLPEIGLVGLAYGETGMRQLTNNSKPIESPEDLNGLKIRTMENEVQIDTFVEFGANASPFAFGELYSALQQNVYDGMDNPLNLIDQMKFYEVQDYLTMSYHSYTATVAFMNADIFNDMPEEFQTTIKESALESMDYQREIARQQDDEGLEVIKEHMEINELTDEQKESFIEVAKTIYDKYEDEIGPEVMELVREYID